MARKTRTATAAAFALVFVIMSFFDPFCWQGGVWEALPSAALAAALAAGSIAAANAIFEPDDLADCIIYSAAGIFFAFALFRAPEFLAFEPSSWTVVVPTVAVVTTLVLVCAYCVVPQQNKAFASGMAKTFGGCAAFVWAAVVIVSATLMPAESLVLTGEADEQVSGVEGSGALVARVGTGPLSQSRLTDDLASLAASEAVYLGMDPIPVVAVFKPEAPSPAWYVQETESIVMNVRYYNGRPHDSAFYALHEVFHVLERKVVDGEIKPEEIADRIARDFATEHADEWTAEFSNYQGFMTGSHDAYSRQKLETDADAYARLRLSMLLGEVSYQDRASS